MSEAHWSTAAGVTASPLQQLRAALEAGDVEAATALAARAEERFHSLQSYSINWITSLLSWIGEHEGEPAVEAALRRFGDTYLANRRGSAWSELPAQARAKSIARSMVANGAVVEIDEDDEKIELRFRCGSGGRLIDEHAYDGEDGYLTLTSRGPMTFDRDALPVYCAHCSVNNEIQPIEESGVPMTVQHPPSGPGEWCVHHLYRRPEDIPDEIYARFGKERP